MSTRQAPQKTIALSLAVIMGLGTWCASALAANETQVPCPKVAAHAQDSLHEILDGDSKSGPLQTIDATELVTLPALSETSSEPADVQVNETEPSDEVTIRNTEIPDIATRLPGVAGANTPRFHRYMLRTDI